MVELDRLLRLVVDERASDAHLKVGSRPHLRVDGALRPTPLDLLEPGDTVQVVQRVLGPDQADAVAAGHEAEGVYSIRGLGRFRVSAFRQRGRVGVVFRRIVPGVPDLATLGLPAVARQLAESSAGVVLVAGLAGSGRTSTLAAMVDHVNATRAAHIVTIEQPIEVVHSDKHSVVDQREVGRDTPSYSSALDAVAHQDPDVVVVGALPDFETARSALEIADGGRLVIAVVQAIGAPDAVTRIVDEFPPAQRDPARALLARTLAGVLCQRLLPRASGRGRTPAVEVLTASGPVTDALASPEGMQELGPLITDGEMWGMQTFDQSLAKLYERGLVTRADALAHASYAPGLTIRLNDADRVAPGAPIAV